jgi:perosamine synthetase
MREVDVSGLTVDIGQTIQEAMIVIDKGGIGACLVVKQNTKLYGLVTDGDIRRALLSGATMETNIDEVANTNPVTAIEGNNNQYVYSTKNRRVRHVPVLNSCNDILSLLFFSPDNIIPIARPYLQGNELKYLTECVTENWISSSGKFIEDFEAQFASFCESKYAVAVSNGTVALHLSLVVMGIGVGDEVLVPSLSFVATANAVRYTGAKPIFIDSEEDTLNINPYKLEESITKNTKAIIPVHLYGKPAKMDKIMEIADKYKIAVIEDAAEAHGAEVMNKKVGSIGIMGCFSFYGNKIITTGEGGMLVTNNKDLYEKARILRDHGMSLSKKYWHDLVGFNYRMTNMQAAIGCAQMEKVDSILKTKRNIGSMYNKFFSGHKSLILPKSDNFSKHIYWMYPVIFNLQGKDNNKIRDDIADLLKLFKIDSRPFFFPIHIMPPYYENCSLPVSEKLSLTGIVLPSYVGITNNEIKKICNIILNRISELS